MIDRPTASVSPCRMRRNVVICFLPVAFELEGSLFRRVLRQHPRPRRLSHGDPLLVAYVSKITQRLLRPGGHQHLAPDLEEAVEPVPPVADYRRGARPGLEQANARRVTRLLHRGARDVQRESLLRIKHRMLAGREMDLPEDVPRPLDFLW